MTQFIAPWMDSAALSKHINICVETIDRWVKMGVLPPPRKRGGKNMWKWSEVDQWLDTGNPNVQSSGPTQEESIREATRTASQRSY